MFTKHFTLHEAIYLPSWSREATLEDGLTEEVQDNLKALFTIMDSVREYFNKPIVVHVAFRPTKYNEQIGGAKNSAHLYGKAVDFHVQGMECADAIKKILEDNKLQEWNLRMENNGEAPTWIHLGNDYKDGHNRYFIP